MDNQIIIKGRLITKSSVLEKPEFFKDTSMLVFLLPETYKQPMLDYYNEHGMKKDMELQISPWPEDITTRATKHFFALRDAFVTASQGDLYPDRVYKDQCYRDCVRELGLTKEGKLVDSLKDLDKRELWQCTELMKQWCDEAGADTRNLSHKEIQKELKE